MRVSGAGMVGLVTLALLAGCRQLFGIEEGRLLDAAPPPDADPTPDATPPECVPAPSGLVAWWRAEGDASDSWGDFDGTLMGSAGFGDGRVGQALELDGVDDAIRIDVEDPFYPAGSFSLEAWIATTRTFGSLVQRYECGGDSCAAGAYAAYSVVLADGMASFRVRDGDGDGGDDMAQVLLGSTRIDDGVFHHVVAVRDVEADEIRLMVDGELSATDALTPVAADPITPAADGEIDPVVIGASSYEGDPPFGNFLLGQLDEVSYYSRALSEDEAVALFASGSAGKCQ